MSGNIEERSRVHITRTFKPRRRPLTPLRAEQFERLAPRLCLDETGDDIEPATVFGRLAPLVLEVGIGFGDSLVSMAADDPDRDVIGVDVHTPGIAATLARVDDLGLTNVRVVHGDALVFLARLRRASLDGVRVFFPDPWPKARHRHRRIVGEGRLDELVDRLAVGGRLDLATDVEDYAAQMRRVCDAHLGLVGGVIDRPAGRPVTRYERKGLAAGRTITDLRYRRVTR